PGNIQGRHRKETGPKGSYLVKINRRGVQLEFIPLQGVEILEMQLDLRKHETITQIKEAIIKKVKEQSLERQLIYLTFLSYESQVDRLGLMDRLMELLDLINEQLLDQYHWQYIYKYKLRIPDEDKAKVDSFFMKEIHDVLNELDLIETI